MLNRICLTYSEEDARNVEFASLARQFWRWEGGGWRGRREGKSYPR
jgi:hypothetical protein